MRRGFSPFKLVFTLLITINTVFISWYALHGDLHFHSDIGRDFLLFQEVVDKKIVLIGQRSGIGQVYHGPLWLYLNVPVFVIGGGNPVAVAWFWVLLMVGFLVSTFLIAKKLVGEKSALFLTLLLSVFVIPYTRELSHPAGAMLVMPVFFYTLWQYVSTFKVRFLVLNILFAGALIQFEMAAGIPIFLLSFGYAVFQMFKAKKLKHVFVYFLLLLPMSTFILFDVTHDFLQFKGILTYLTERPQNNLTFLDVIYNRLNFVTSAGTPFFYVFGFGHTFAVVFDLLNRVFAVGFFALLFLFVRRGINKKLYMLFLYLFGGYFILSFTNRGILYGHHFLPFVPIVFLIFASVLVKLRAKFIFILFLVIFSVNEISAVNYIKSAGDFIGKNEDSWKALSQIPKDVFDSSDKSFSYFVYSPDLLGYEAKYAMIWGRKKAEEKDVVYFQKRPIMYIIAAPPPPNDPYMHDLWWIINEIKLTKQPEKILRYQNGYKLKRYELTEEEVATPFNTSADSGIHFR